jgi:hypothetical protein
MFDIYSYDARSIVHGAIERSSENNSVNKRSLSNNKVSSIIKADDTELINRMSSPTTNTGTSQTPSGK